MITFNHLNVGFNHSVVLENLCGEIAPGQLIALMGVNGKGKSTLIKTLSGLISSLSGDLSLDKKKMSEVAALDRARAISIVLTEKIEMDHLTVSDLLALGRAPYNGAFQKLNDADRFVIETVTSNLKINSLTNKYFSELSDGQKQKTLLARALIQEPRFLFLDEPTTFLDIPSKIDLMNCLKQTAADKKVGILFSTHDLELAKRNVDLIWLLDNKGVLHKGSPEDLESAGLFALNFHL